MGARSPNWLLKISGDFCVFFVGAKQLFLEFSLTIDNHTLVIKKIRSDLVEIKYLYNTREGASGASNLEVTIF